MTHQSLDIFKKMMNEVGFLFCPAICQLFMEESKHSNLLTWNRKNEGLVQMTFPPRNFPGCRDLGMICAMRSPPLDLSGRDPGKKRQESSMVDVTACDPGN